MDPGTDPALLVGGLLMAAVALWLLRNLVRLVYVAALLTFGLWLAGLFR